MEQKNKMVVKKDHELVRKAINKFSYKQNQLMCALLGKYIHTKGNYFINTTITVSEFCSLLELTAGKNNYVRIKKAVDSFGENGSVGIYDDKKGKYIWRPYFKKIELDETSVTFVWNDEMYPDLIGLQKKYTGYLANDYLKLGSVYSQNLYEQMKSYQNMPVKPQIFMTIEDLHRIMQINLKEKPSYKNFNKFKTVCISRAVDDINEKTDIFVEYETIKDKKDKRKAAGLAFTIRPKEEFFNYNGCWLNGEQINDIIYKLMAKNKIIELGIIKKENKDYYTLLRKGDKTDYQIIENFAFRDKLRAGEMSEEDICMQELARKGNVMAQSYCDNEGIKY